jgi:c-di-GMP-binding flagellar brake protein YcgR
MVLERRQEKRKSLRYPKRRAGEVIFGAHERPVRCVIWDISDGGARLAVARPLEELPPTFTLVLFKDVQRDCQVVWTDARFVGVKFV